MGNCDNKISLESYFRAGKGAIELFQHRALCVGLVIETTAFFGLV